MMRRRPQSANGAIMPLSVIAIILPFTLLVVLVVVLFAACRRTGRAIDALDLPVRARCGSCGRELELTMAELRRAHMTKSVSRTRTGQRGPALVTTRSFSTFQKRLRCLACGESGWCEVLNIGELQSAATGIAVRYMGGALALMVVLGFALSAVSDIFL